MSHSVALKHLPDALRVDPGSRVDLGTLDTAGTFGLRKADAAKAQDQRGARLVELGSRLRAEHRHALLVVIHGPEPGCMDDLVRDVLDPLEPQVCTATWFKVPNPPGERDGYEWRVHAITPDRGTVGVLERSPYDDLQAARVRGTVDETTFRRRCRSINDVERALVADGTGIVKLFLLLDGGLSGTDRAAGARRGAGPVDGAGSGVATTADPQEHDRRSDDIAAFSECLCATSTEVAPWYVVPAGRRWFRNVAASEIVAQALERLEPR